MANWVKVVARRQPRATWEAVGTVQALDGRLLTVRAHRGGQSKVRLCDGDEVVLEFKASAAFTLGNLMLAGGRV